MKLSDVQFNVLYHIKGDPNQIDESGVEEIREYIGRAVNLRNPEWAELLPPGYDPYDYKKHRLPDFPDDWEWVWVQQKKGKYGTGKFPKRYSKYVHDTIQLDVPEPILQKIGEIARNHSSDSKGVTIDFTDDFNWRNGDFGDDVSCFWGGREVARTIMMDNGAWAVRFWTPLAKNDDHTRYRMTKQDADGNWYKGQARAWMAVNHPQKDDIILFNGYGFEGDPLRLATKILSELFGYGYYDCRLCNNDEDAGKVYINGGRGFVLSARSEKVKKHDFHWPDRIEGRCHHCQCVIYEGDDYRTEGGRYYCSDCAEEMFADCEHCGRTVFGETLEEVRRFTGEYWITEHLCANCIRQNTIICDHCGERVYGDDESTQFIDGEGVTLCVRCAEEEVAECCHCGTDHFTENMGETAEGELICEVCETILAEQGVQ